jgi:hypothetical protein
MRSQVKGLAEVTWDHDLVLIDDITYRDFNPDHVLASEFYPEKTLLSYSLSKAPGLAGMRIGAILGPAELMKHVKKYDTNPFGVNVLARMRPWPPSRRRRSGCPGSARHARRTRGQSRAPWTSRTAPRCP